MDGEVVTTGMEWLATATETVTTVFGTAVDLMTSNPIVTVFMAVPIIGIGFSIFRKAKRSAGK